MQSVSGGVFLSSKQYMVLLFGPALTVMSRIRAVLTALAVMVLPALPFMLWNFKAFWHQMVSTMSGFVFRDDSLTIAVLVKAKMGIQLTRVPGVLATLAVLAVWAVYGRKADRAGSAAWGSAIMITFFAGSQFAFPNYYYTVMGLQLSAIMLSLSEVDGRELS